ncbi:endolytic transglycosylase MltG [Sporanaerobacter acetigenes]|uniref:YceG-like family protein n=1 Tax=Sporanaerobacter acetigenes DSM 13106 TaxID=1123281 RepID=A0A1M5XU67_9FIRM|nr:endolytic transglycosylase MltG [Sporanaerobacter acetigenes]SHI03084.1 YceG-like family protein [Sporanaerobacter acetigenes DSM 13106]
MKGKLKIVYMILGIGIGIILTSFVFAMKPNVKYKEYTNEEIMDRAKELGMVSVKENINVDDVRENLKEDIELENNSEITIKIGNNETLSKIADGLFESEIIDDKGEFIQFVKDKGMETKLRPGTYSLKKNMSYTSIIKILTKTK